MALGEMAPGPDPDDGVSKQGREDPNRDPAYDEFVSHINEHVAPLFSRAMEPVGVFLFGEKQPTYPLLAKKSALPGFEKYDLEGVTIRYVEDDVDPMLGALPTLRCGIVPRASLDKLPYITAPVDRTIGDFVWLRNTLVLELPGLIVPPFPAEVTHAANLLDKMTPSELKVPGGGDRRGKETKHTQSERSTAPSSLRIDAPSSSASGGGASIARSRGRCDDHATLR
jgi:hypothetical protein